MSNITRIRTQMVEKEYLLKALDDLHYAYQEGNARIGLAGPRADIRVRVGARTVGFQRSGASYVMVTGDWGGMRRSRWAPFLQQVTQRYAYHAAKARLEEQGFTLVSEEVQEGERIHLVLRRLA